MDPDIARRAAKAAANWHGAWALALGAGACAWFATAGTLAPAEALAAAAAPGAVGLALRWSSGSFVRTLTALAWPLGVGAALVMTGGIAGPLAVLALAPAAAMAALDGRRLIAVGAMLSVASICAVMLGDANGLVIPAPAVGGAWLTLAALLVSALALPAALLIVRARSAEREAPLALEAAALRNVLDAGPLVLRLDRNGTVREAFGNAGGGLTPVGRSFESLAGEGDRPAARAALAILRRDGAASVGFAPPMAPDRWLAAELRALPGGEAAVSMRDVSLERAMEAYLEQARRDAENMTTAKSRFLANMSHELRTPLNAIIGFSDIMRSRMFGPLLDRYAEYAALIHESGGHLLDLINDVLDMSKIEAERFVLAREDFDAREAVSAALRLTRVQADTARIALRGALPAEPIEVDADRRALKQIVLNLVSNALKFTPSGGQVNVLARKREGELELIVADTGIGISREDLERLGRPYEQAGAADQRQKGTGLGLSLVRALAELHGGRMVIRSVLGEGTAVSVRLPVLLEDEAPAEDPPAAASRLHEPRSHEPRSSGPRDPWSAPPPERRAAAVGDNVIPFNPQR